MKTPRLVGMTVLLAALSTSLWAQQSWREFISGVQKEAIQQGITPSVVYKATAQLRPSKKVLRLDRSQPEGRLTYLRYRNTRADAYRIKLGRRELAKHQPLLNTIADHYGVSPCFIVSLWGLETSFGRFRGSFPVIQSLATLAYDGRRGTFFRHQLMLALQILDQGHVELANYKGEWAGASGHPQFLPSSWHDYAVDYNQDGYRDIWNTLPDALASIANYLKGHGWIAGAPVSMTVRLPARFDRHLVGLESTKTVAQWRALGVRLDRGRWPDPHMAASIVTPDGGPSLMVFNNFKVLMKWNRSVYYAGTVEYMANAVCRQR